MAEQSSTYRTVDGDVLDVIVLSHYGRNADAVTPVMAANPHLRAYPSVLPEGLEITLPVLPSAPAQPSIFLLP